MPESVHDQLADFARPLIAFCGEGAASALEILQPEELPEPYRTLLVHDTDMTGTLERYRGQKMKLHPVEQFVENHNLVRHVELCGSDDGLPAEFGAIEIRLDQFEAGPRAAVLQGDIPLGSILKHAGIEFKSRPRAYFRIKPGEAVRHSFGVPADGWLFGRCNQLLTVSGELLADVVEILPPSLPTP
jgi:chorismate-pyruvate lyase